MSFVPPVWARRRRVLCVIGEFEAILRRTSFVLINKSFTGSEEVDETEEVADHGKGGGVWLVEFIFCCMLQTCLQLPITDLSSLSLCSYPR